MKKWAPLLWLTVVGMAAWVLTHRLRAIDFGDVVNELRTQPVSAVLGALACCIAAYTLVGVYEGIAARIATGRPRFLLPFRTALIANPIGRAIGAAMLSGGAVRYRMYTATGMSIRQVGALIVLVAMPYFLGVGWLVDLSFLFNAAQAGGALRLPAAIIMALGAVGLAKDIGWLVLVSLRREPVVIRGQSIRLPTLRDTFVQIAFGLTQISLMAAMLYLFMPPELGMSYPAFVVIYCIAYIAGQLSNVPVGLGVLEAALLLMLPQVPPAKLLGAVLAYRGIFELLPLLFALLLLLIHESTHPTGVMRKWMPRRQGTRTRKAPPRR